MPHPRYTPLRERHEALGATFTDFGGWQMPVRYSSDLAEHHAVRTAAGVFDISHMAEFAVEGPDAAAYLDAALGARLSTVAVGRAKYSLLLADDAGIIDDVIVYRLHDDRFLMISNAGNRDAVAEALSSRIGSYDVTVTDVSDDYALIAVQGPRSEELMARVEPLSQLGVPWNEQKYFAWTDAAFRGSPLLIARTGYTGEDGFELLVGAADAVALWDALLTAGEPLGAVPAGLAARDTLRLEAGMPLYGHEIARDIRPAEAGLERTVATDKTFFVGQEGWNAQPKTPEKVLVGLRAEGRRAGRAGYAVVDAAGVPVGTVTSGVLSPTLGYPIAMAFVSPVHAAIGTEVFIDVRGTKIPATVTGLPFYTRRKK